MEFGFSIEVQRGKGPGKPPGTRAFMTRMGKIEKGMPATSRRRSEKIRKSFYAAERRQYATLGGPAIGRRTLPPPSRGRRASGEDLRPMRATGALYRALTTGAGARRHQ
jgi:hypothetical protein